MSISLRTPTTDDVPAVGKVVYDAFESIARKHNFPLDFPSLDAALGLAGMFVTHPQFVGFVATDDTRGGAIVGCNFLSKRNVIGGVGPVCVDPAQQSRGVGRKVMRAVIDAGESMRGIRLVQDAFNTTSMSLYASLGFETREPLALMRGKLNSERGSSAHVRLMTESDLRACAELCTRVHGFDRTVELQDALKMLRPHVLERNGRIAAYASSPWMWFLNHAVAESEQDLRDLLTGVSAAGPDPLMMLIPTRQAGLFRWLLAEGVRVIKPMTLMTTGWYQEPKSSWFPSVEY